MLKFAGFIMLSAVCFIFVGCENIPSVQGSGNVKSETRNVSGFKKIKANGAIKFEIVAQKDFGLTIEADDNLLQFISTEVNGDTLDISTKGNISPKTKLKMKITLPELVDLDFNGASEAVVSDVKSESFKINANGSSKVKISGEVKDLKAEANGASNIDAENFKTENAEIKANGASSATVAPTNELNADANGASKILYVGEPKNIKQSANGASSIKKK